MRRWLPGMLIIGTACSGRAHPATQPATVAAKPDTVGAGRAARVDGALVVEPGPPVAPRKSSVASNVITVHDSAADAAALDSLNNAHPSAVLPDLPIDAHPTWDLNVADFSDQPRVKYYLDYFTGRSRDRFQIWLDRMARYESYARSRFASHKLPGDFVYLALIESGFSPEAVSRTAAVGMWQFMLGTGKLYNLRVDSWLDERRDPIKSTDAAAALLDDLTQRFGSHYLAAAAYNAGAGRVQRGLGAMGSQATSDSNADVSGDDAFFSLADTRMIRDETKNYVPQLIAAAIIAKEPARYDFAIHRDVTPFSRDSVIVDGGTSLELVARLADTTLESLRDLNPHLLRMVTPPGEKYPVRVPTGTADRIAAGYAGLSPAERCAVLSHQVKSGETVVALAHKYNASADLIRSANRSARGRALVPGSVLYIPLGVSAVTASMLREPDPPRTIRSVTRTVVVRAGETVASVAKRAGVSAVDLRDDNHLRAGVALHAGQRLVVHRTMLVVATTGRPVSKTAPVASSAVADAKPVAAGPRSRATAGEKVPPADKTRVAVARTHVVKRGETLTAIAGAFGVKPAEIIALNHLEKSGHVQAGQTIKIPG